MKKASAIVLAMIVSLAIGFFSGRSSIDSEPKKEYIKGETLTGSVSPTQFEPIKEEKPDKSLLPFIQYRDTGSVRYMPIDSAAYAKLVIADYELKRTYKLTAFDNKTQGKLDLFPVIQYNRLSALDYNFTPVIERQTIYKTKIWQPFISASYSTLNYIGIGGGIFYHDIGIEYQYQKSLGSQSNGHLFGVKYKF
ncbi:hypothetical protein IR148_00575 [Dysgonomonas mossii]|uniref:Uncharacterized protein n=1 Tax=Dysgonomonas mossii TaxID=163665 RepID=A0A4Y9IQB9_9BACT|nr:hypothetical protein [Dysgonomonas mossii]MBF0759536.1 hypothetical protein [Dysgonomonas mossii]TFU90502.1 hypothetical protein E4T88_00570 [Dysgonomonas mossii]